MRAPDAPPRPAASPRRRSVFAALTSPRGSPERPPPFEPAAAAEADVVATLGAGRTGGLLELLAGTPARPYAYVADRLTQVFEFPNDATKGLMERTPALRDALLAAAARDFSQAALAGRGDVVARGIVRAGDDLGASDLSSYGGCGLLVGKAGAARAPALVAWPPGAAPDVADGSVAVLFTAADMEEFDV